jgi:hypothetical protein
VKERQTGRQEVETVLTERGTTERRLGRERGAPSTLSDAQLAQLGEIGGKVERHFGVPQDIEWAYAGGRFWVLQARPITNLPPAPLKDVRWEPPFPDSAWCRRATSCGLVRSTCRPGKHSGATSQPARS